MMQDGRHCWDSTFLFIHCVEWHRFKAESFNYKKKKDSTCYKLILVERLYFYIERDGIMIEQVAKCRQDNNHSVQHII